MYTRQFYTEGHLEHKTCLNKFIKGNGVIAVGVGLLNGPISDAAQLVIRDVDPDHHPQDLKRINKRPLHG